jgi:hypothetical protein
MRTFTIQEGQNGLDLANNTYADLNFISDLYLKNPEFDVNKMQPGLAIDWEVAELTQIQNDIINNSYIFKNLNVIVYKELFNLTVKPGEYNINLGIKIFNTSINQEYLPTYLIESEEDYTNIYEGSLTDVNFKAFDSENNMIVKTDADFFDQEFIYTAFNFNGIYLKSIDIEEVKVGYNFNLSFEDQDIEDYSFISKLQYASLDLTEDITTISVKNSLQTVNSLNSFLDNLLSSTLSNTQDSGVIITSSADQLLTGTSWTALQALGWTNTIV